MQYDILIIGSGIIGLTLGLSLLEKNKSLKVGIIDKESHVGFHGSGRNSGVLHAGFYYMEDSLKAKFARLGSQALKEYCQDRGIPIRNNGKIVVTKNESELAGLYELKKRGETNNVEVHLISAKEAFEIEPYARTFKEALYCPATATLDPKLVCHNLIDDLKAKHVDFFFNTPYQRRTPRGTIIAGGKEIMAKKYINAAGLYADKIAADFGAGSGYSIVPFKGIYLECKDKAMPLETNIYPVPNLKNPFLGVHFTVTPSGKVKIGPTAIPAFWRENYKGFSRFQGSEFFDVMTTQAHLFFKNSFNFRRLAYEELCKMNATHLRKLASDLVRNIDLARFNSWGVPGIRAQLIDKRSHALVQDFVVEKGEDSVHILNAVSPAFTCSFPFSKWVIDAYLQDIA